MKLIHELKCFFGFHSFQPYKVTHYNDISWGDRAPSTELMSKCPHCKKVKFKNYYGRGFLKLDDFR